MRLTVFVLLVLSLALPTGDNADAAGLSGPDFVASTLGSAPLSDVSSVAPILSRLIATPAGGEIAPVTSPEIWHVENGELQLTDQNGTVTNYSAGQTVEITNYGSYEYVISGEGCPSVLRFQSQATFAMQVGEGETAPLLGPDAAQSCSAGFDFNSAPGDIELPAGNYAISLQLIDAVAYGASGEVQFSGLALFAVSSGAIDLTSGTGNLIRLPAGGSYLAQPGESVSMAVVGDQPAVLYLGLIDPTGESVDVPQELPHDYISSVWGFTVDWPDEWAISSQSADNGIETLVLVKGTGSINITAVSGYSDGNTCLDSAASTYTADAGFASFQFDPLGSTSVTDQAVRRSYIFTWTGSSTPVDYRVEMTCQIYPSGLALYTSFTETTALFDAEWPGADAVISSIIVPDS